MRLIACATTKHSFDMGHGSEQLVFDGKSLELEDDVAAHLLAESPHNFTDETPPAAEDEKAGEGVDATSDTGSKPADSTGE